MFDGDGDAAACFSVGDCGAVAPAMSAAWLVNSAFCINWKRIEKLILCNRLCPFFAAAASPSPVGEECPICFRLFPIAVNRTKCCLQPLCTECFLQLKPPRLRMPHGSNASKHTACPYCANTHSFSVVFFTPQEVATAAAGSNNKVFDAKQLYNEKKKTKISLWKRLTSRPAYAGVELQAVRSWQQHQQ